jgi:hypothetical protein
VLPLGPLSAFIENLTGYSSPSTKILKKVKFTRKNNSRISNFLVKINKQENTYLFLNR